MHGYRVSAYTLSVIRSLAPKHFGTHNAPSTYAALEQAWAKAQRTNSPFPVYSGGCESTIYGAPEDNYAFRAWHDSIHIALKAGFDVIGESAVANEQLRQLRDHGVSAQDCLAAGFVASYLARRERALTDITFLLPLVA